MANIEDYPKSYPTARKADLSKGDNWVLFKSIMNVDLTPDTLSNIHKYLGSIYINGKNLSDTLGEDAVFDDYMNAVRDALSLDNSDYVTIMNRNSIFADPKPVIVEDNYGDPEMNAVAEAKNVHSLKYTENYREEAYNSVTNAQKNIDARMESDAHLFFDFLFYNEDGSLKNPNADPKKMDSGTLTSDMFNKHIVSNISPGFVLPRHSEHSVYTYMFTKDYPEGSGQKMTYERLMTEPDTQAFRDFKKKIGKEFCEIFLKPGEDENNYEDYKDHFNTKTFPAMQKMAEALMNMTANYHDLSEKDNLDKAVLESRKNSYLQDMSQQFPNTSLGNIFTTSALGITSMQNALLTQRLQYMESQAFHENQDFTANNNILSRSQYSTPGTHLSVYAQAMADSIDVKSLCGVTYGSMGAEYSCALGTETMLGGIFTPPKGVPPMNVNVYDEMNKYKRGEPNAFIEDRQKEVRKGNIKRIIQAAADPAERDPEQYDIDAIRGGNGNFVGGRFSLDMPMIRKFEQGETIYTGTNANEAAAQCREYEGLQKGLINMLTGCPTYQDEYQLLEAANNIYINDKTMAEYFGLDLNNIQEKIKDCEKNLASIIRQGVEGEQENKEYVYIKTGKDTFNTLSLYNDNKEAMAYMNLLNGVDKQYNVGMGTVENIDIAQSMKDAAGVLPIPPGMVTKSIEKITETLGKGSNDYGDVLVRLVGGSIFDIKDLEKAGKDIYIGDKPLSDIYKINPNKDVAEQKKEMGKLLHDTFMSGITKNGEPKPITYRNENGNMVSLKLEVPEIPEKPRPVKPLNRFVAFFSSAATVERNRRDVANYITASQTYLDTVEKHNAFSKYNATADKARFEVLKAEKDGPSKKTVSIHQILKSRGTAASPERTHAVAERQTEHNGPAMGN